MGSTGTRVSDKARQNVFTTGEAAKICGVSQQTIIRCFDSGRLEGFKVPGSRFRRIPRDELIRFMKDNEIPLDPILGDRKRVLVIDDDNATLQAVVDAALHNPHLDIKIEFHLFGAGFVMATFHPEVIVLGALLPMETMERLVEYVHQDNPNVTFVILTPANMDDAAIRRIIRAGVTTAIQKPTTWQSFVEKINDLLGVTSATTNRF